MKSSKSLIAIVVILAAVVVIGIAMSSGTNLLQGRLTLPLNNAQVFGNLSITKLPIASTTFQANQQNLELLKFNVTALAPVTSTGFTFSIVTTGSGFLTDQAWPNHRNFDNFEVIDVNTGTVLAVTPIGSSNDAGGTFDFYNLNLTPVVKSTTYTLALVTDVSNYPNLADAPTTITAKLENLFGTAVSVQGDLLTAVP